MSFGITKNCRRRAVLSHSNSYLLVIKAAVDGDYVINVDVIFGKLFQSLSGWKTSHAVTLFFVPPYLEQLARKTFVNQNVGAGSSTC